MIAAYVHRASTREIVLEHLRMAPHAHKDPEELSDFIDQIYHAGQDPEGNTSDDWMQVSMDVEGAYAFFDHLGVFRGLGVKDNDTVRRYREKLSLSTPPPGALAVDERGDVYVIDGRHRLLALHQARRSRSLWYVPKRNYDALQAALRAFSAPVPAPEAPENIPTATLSPTP